MKVTEKVKKGLECCFQYSCCIGCPYFDPKAPKTANCVSKLGIEALLCIQQLQNREGRTVSNAE